MRIEFIVNKMLEYIVSGGRKGFGLQSRHVSARALARQVRVRRPGRVEQEAADCTLSCATSDEPRRFGVGSIPTLGSLQQHLPVTRRLLLAKVRTKDLLHERGLFLRTLLLCVGGQAMPVQ